MTSVSLWWSRQVVARLRITIHKRTGPQPARLVASGCLLVLAACVACSESGSWLRKRRQTDRQTWQCHRFKPPSKDVGGAYPFDAHCCHMSTAIMYPVPALAVICNFWHTGTLTLSPERQTARMSKITNDCLTRSGTECFIPWQQWASKG